MLLRFDTDDSLNTPLVGSKQVIDLWDFSSSRFYEIQSNPSLVDFSGGQVKRIENLLI